MTISDLHAIAAIFCVSFVCLFLTSGTLYWPFKSDLAKSKIGRTYCFDYLQPANGERERYFGTVVSVTKLDRHDIEFLNTSDYRKRDRNFKRTNTLITCKMQNGDFRRFYAERTSNCRRVLKLGSNYLITSLIG